MQRSKRNTLAALGAAAALSLGTALPRPALAENSQVRISQQFGLNWLAVTVMLDQKLIQKRARELGVDQLDVTLVKLSGGSAVNDALLSGSIDVGGMGGPPSFIMTDRTAGRRTVRAIGAVVDAPMSLVTIDPAVRSIEDLTDKDRIALPAPKVSINAMMLQMAAAKRYGYDRASKYDALGVGMPHPDATATLIAGNGQVKNYVGIFPYTEQVLKQAAGARVILTSYDVMGEHNLAVLSCTEAWKSANPKTFRAVAMALDDALAYINADKRRAAELYVRTNKSNLSAEQVYEMISAPQVVFSSTPKGTMAFAEFMYRIGSLKHKPESWKQYFWENQHGKPGS